MGKRVENDLHSYTFAHDRGGGGAAGGERDGVGAGQRRRGGVGAGSGRDEVGDTGDDLGVAEQAVVAEALGDV